MRIVQRGTAPDIAVLYLVGAHLDDALRSALGPIPWIVAFDTPPWTMPDRVVNSVGIERARHLVLVGFSAGCQGVREAIRTSALPPADRIGVVAIDGTHASMPPEPWQITTWQILAEQARRRERLFVATCTAQTYVEALPASTRFLSTLSVLRQAIDPTLTPNTPPDERHEGDLHVYAYASGRIDKAAHIAQQRDVLPELLGRHVVPWMMKALDETRPDAPGALRDTRFPPSTLARSRRTLRRMNDTPERHKGEGPPSGAPTADLLWLVHRDALGGRSSATGAPLPLDLISAPPAAQAAHHAIACFEALIRREPMPTRPSYLAVALAEGAEAVAKRHAAPHLTRGADTVPQRKTLTTPVGEFGPPDDPDPPPPPTYVK